MRQEPQIGPLLSVLMQLSSGFPFERNQPPCVSGLRSGQLVPGGCSSQCLQVRARRAEGTRQRSGEWVTRVVAPWRMRRREWRRRNHGAQFTVESLGVMMPHGPWVRSEISVTRPNSSGHPGLFFGKVDHRRIRHGPGDQFVMVFVVFSLIQNI